MYKLEMMACAVLTGLTSLANNVGVAKISLVTSLALTAGVASWAVAGHIAVRV